MALTESMFGLAADVEDDRLCRDIPDSQYREEPRNLVRVTLAHIGSIAGDALADPKVVMPWLMGGGWGACIPDSDDRAYPRTPSLAAAGDHWKVSSAVSSSASASGFLRS